LVHANIKPSNILIVRDPTTQKEVIKLCDPECDYHQSFMNQNSNNHMMGAHGYKAPESYEAQMDKRFKILIKQDIWAIGIIIHQLLTNNHPIITTDLRSVEELKGKVMKCDFTIHSDLKGTVYEKIIMSCLRKKP